MNHCHTFWMSPQTILQFSLITDILSSYVVFCTAEMFILDHVTCHLTLALHVRIPMREWHYFRMKLCLMCNNLRLLPNYFSSPLLMHYFYTYEVKLICRESLRVTFIAATLSALRFTMRCTHLCEQLLCERNRAFSVISLRSITIYTSL